MKNKGYIVLSAHHCAPHKGSEHAVGWNAITEISKKYNLIVITEDNKYRDDFLKEIKALNDSGRVIKPYFVKHGLVSDGRKNNLRLGYYLTYVLYQFRVYSLVKKLHNEYKILLIHQLTIVGFREPGFLWKLPYPFVWGPVGGLVYAPRELVSNLSFRMRVFQVFRNFATWLQFNLSTRVNSAYKKCLSSGRFIAAEPSIGDRFVSRFGGEYSWIPETGSKSTDLYDLPYKITQKENSKLKILWLGALIDIKPMELLLDGIASSIHKDKVELVVVGDGDSKTRYLNYAEQLGISVNFVGWVDHSLVREFYLNADLFCLFSMKDLTTNVVFESLGNGLPVMCFDHHGYSFIVDESCGIKIGISHVSSMIDEIKENLDDCIEGRICLRTLSVGACQKASKFTWENNMKRIVSIYDGIINENA